MLESLSDVPSICNEKESSPGVAYSSLMRCPSCSDADEELVGRCILASLLFCCQHTKSTDLRSRSEPCESLLGEDKPGVSIIQRGQALHEPGLIITSGDAIVLQAYSFVMSILTDDIPHDVQTNCRALKSPKIRDKAKSWATGTLTRLSIHHASFCPLHIKQPLLSPPLLQAARCWRMKNKVLVRHASCQWMQQPRGSNLTDLVIEPEMVVPGAPRHGYEVVHKLLR
ncbi:hypothetical protein CGRA01v4_01215 [Colletotrichum graminicola]|nr:hypothetical protein CGRA01v4_01215 [Colletotrichum graminicola]